MVDHGETFWALFGVDLNVVLEQQPPDTWDTFPVFQMLNNYLRNHGTVLVVVSISSSSSLSCSCVCLFVSQLILLGAHIAGSPHARF